VAPRARKDSKQEPLGLVALNDLVPSGRALPGCTRTEARLVSRLASGAVAAADGGLVHWRHDHAPDVRECSGDLLPVIVYCTASIHGGMEESA
jgi:hypothetical protein